jgi:hypothetical protein
MYSSESKGQRGENSDFLFLGRTLRVDVFGRIFLGSQNSSQMAAYGFKSKNVEFSVNINNLQGVPTQTCTLHFALADRNMQASFGLKVVWEF